MARKSLYHGMKAHDLARITRERGLDKPNVITLSEWADYLEADDAKRLKQASKQTDADRDTEDARAQDSDTGKAAPKAGTKAKR